MSVRAVPMFLLCLACGDDEPGSAREGPATWFTEAEYQISGAPQEDVLFSEVPYLRADPYRDRVFVIDLRDAQVSAWTPEGSLFHVLRGGRNGRKNCTGNTHVGHLRRIPVEPGSARG